LKLIFVLFVTIITFQLNLAQTYSITGKISSSKNGEGLSFANVRLLNTTIGTASNTEGDYVLKLKSGDYRIVATYIGFKSDTAAVHLSGDVELDFKLQRVTLRLSEVTVMPGINPALAIIRKAMAAKKDRNQRLHDYEFTAYTKGVIKTIEEIRTNDNSVNLDLGGAVKNYGDS
jgi:hypothetical protein